MSRNHRIWSLPDRDITPESAYQSRRDLLKALVAAGLLPGCMPAKPTIALFEAPRGTYPVKQNEHYRVEERELTSEQAATGYNNYYEFSLNHQAVKNSVARLQTKPWKIEIKGLVEKPGIADLEDFFDHLESEERVYRFRCVETWAMTVPWCGFSMKKFVEWVRPMPEAKYVRMKAFHRPLQAINQANFKHYTWPYYEALTIEEATNELTLLAHGIYQQNLPRQNGAPLRLVVPWKYGIKSIKGIVEFEFTKDRPPSFWHDLHPEEYDWHCNVDPNTPHPRWSQRTERLIPSDRMVDTLPFNGYADLVSMLY